MESLKDRPLGIQFFLLHDLPNPGRLSHHTRPDFLSVCPEASAESFWFSKSGEEKVKERKFVVKLSSEILQYRPAGIEFFLFYCRIYPTQEDACIKRDPFLSQFQKSGEEKFK